MTIYARVLRKVERTTYHWLFSGRERQKLRRSSDPSAQAVFRAITATRYAHRSEAERGWMEQIEHLRARLIESTETVEIEDFGAGEAESNLSQDEMAKGNVFIDRVGTVCRRASKSAQWASLLFHLIRESKPQICLELGVCLGISSAYQGAALALNGSGALFSLEGAKGLAAIAEQNLAELGLDQVSLVVGRFADTLPGVLERMQGKVDFAFIDGHHDEHATLAYFEQLKPYLADGALVVFDDIRWSYGMERAWRNISKQSGVAWSVDLYQIGICVYRPNASSTARVRLEL